jgi:aminoglycoside phosphotransferase (APT) family kinase protein
VTGVLDWAGEQLSDPEHDVAVSLVLVAVGAPMLAANVPAAAFEAFAGEYLAAYEKRRPLDPDRLSYYRAYRVLRAFLRGTASRTPGVAQELLPRDNYPWSAEGALRRLADLFQDITGVELPVRAG